MDSDKLNTFDTAASQLKNTIDSAAVDQATLDKSNAALVAAQADVASKQQQVTADVATLQTQFDSLVASALAIGLVVNTPAA